MIWQLAEAKNKFSEVYDRALKEGPQEVTRRGRDRVVMLSGEECDRLRGKKPCFLDFLMSAPGGLDELDLVRSKEVPRPLDM